MEQRASHDAVVIPVILTTADWSTTPFHRLTPIYIDESEKYSYVTARKVRDGLEKVIEWRMKMKLNDFSPAEYSATMVHGTRNSFAFMWGVGAMFVMIILTGVLVWFSRDPVDHNIVYTSASSSPLHFFYGALVIGVAAMCLLQLFRRLFRVRGVFHRDQVTEWLGEDGTVELSDEVGQARLKYFFDLPSELLTGQLGAIADQVLDREDDGLDKPLIEKMAAIKESTSRVVEGDANKPRVNLTLAIQKNLDQFQISTSARWRRYLLLTSILFSTTFFVAGLELFQTGSFIPGLANHADQVVRWIGNFVLLLLATVVTGLLSGFLGSIARDVVAIIEKLRR